VKRRTHTLPFLPGTSELGSTGPARLLVEILIFKGQRFSFLSLSSLTSFQAVESSSTVGTSIRGVTWGTYRMRMRFWTDCGSIANDVPLDKISDYD